jgi:dipeptidyl aminopeptidase/acylaminoacyl peptidase
VLLLALPAVAQDGYRVPPEALAQAALAAPPPSISIAPGGRHLILVEREAMPDIAQLARPVLGLAGIRIDPRRNSRQDTGARAHAMRLCAVADGGERRIELPASADVSGPVWTADGARFAFTNATDDGLEVWVGEVGTAVVRRLDGIRVTDVLGAPLDWMPDSRQLLLRLWPGGEAPAAPVVPSGPNVQETVGRTAPVRTFQDLLRTPHDAALFEHHARSRLAVVDPDTGAVRALGAAALNAGAEPSPDGRHVLVTRIVQPFSYLVTAQAFPRQVVVLDLDGNEVEKVAELPLADAVPIGGVPTGRRGIRWIPTEPDSLCWVEALDGGDEKTPAEHRDQVFVRRLLTRMAPEPWFRTAYRFGSLVFDETGELALATTRDRERRWTRTWKVLPRARDRAPELLDERSQNDAYGDPGTPVTKLSPSGQQVIVRSGNAVFLRGSGASPEGDRPFLRRLDLDTGQQTELFRCPPGRYETVAALLADDATQLLVSRESPTEAPQLIVRDAAGERQLTRYVDAQQELVRGIGRQLLRYRRADGVELSATLYTPPGHRPGEALPTLVWAYPREFVSRDTAGQVRGSPHRYQRLSGTSPLLMLLAGYAVLDDAAMPIVGPKESANDDFVEQLVQDAAAAIAAGAAAGAVDPERCAVGGHSYGAFMTANLLAHSDLFRAGIARSGAYNRTLTPFGFQNERRTYWEAPEIYHGMSPFMHAPRIDEPLLMIHGEMDDNPGTFPVQSQRLYHAIQGHGGTARLVMLPFESHGYRARESVLHVLAESVAWLDRHLKSAGPR